MESKYAIGIALGLVFPLGILIAFIRRRREKARYYAAHANDANEAPIEGSLEELNEVDPKASPWRNDARLKITDTMELIERFDTMRGYSNQYVEDLKTELRKNGIACESLFLEGYPIGGLGSLTTSMGIYEVFADRSELDRALKILREFQSAD